MKRLKQNERAALQAAARDLSGKKGISLKVIVVKQPTTADTEPRLRSDRVVQRIMRQLRKFSGEILPESMAIILTMSAPIRLPRKTALELEKIIRTLPPRRSKPSRYIVHGNQVTLRVVKASASQPTRLIGLVHHRDTDASAIAQITETLFDALGPVVIRRSSTARPNVHCVALVIERASWPIRTYRQIIAQISPDPILSKTLLLATRNDSDLAIALAGTSATLAAS